MFETRRKRTIIVVHITKYSEYVSTYEYYLTDHEWINKKTDFDMKMKDYKYVDYDTILFIKKEKENEKS